MLVLPNDLLTLFDESRAKMFKSTIGYTNFLLTCVTLVTAALSLLNIKSILVNKSYEGFLLYLQQKYLAIRDFFLSFFEPAILWLLDIVIYFDFRLDLQWRDVATLMILYLTAHISHAINGKLKAPFRASAIRIFGGLCAILVACLALTVLGGYHDMDRGIVFVYSCLSGFIIYRFIFAFQFSLDQLLENKGFWSHFLMKTIQGIIFVLICATFLYLAEKIKWLGFRTIISFVFILSLFHLMLGFQTIENFKLYLRRRKSISNGNISIGFRIFVTILIAIWLLIVAPPINTFVL